MGAVRRWTEWLGEWAIPRPILDGAPESPWWFPRRLFEGVEPTPPDTPSSRRALEALEAEPGVILDVGSGGGRASLPLCPPGLAVVAVDPSEELLASFAAEADRRAVEHRMVRGAWPDVAPATPVADLVVCHHVLYNVGDLAPFVRALTGHARRRVVVEVTVEHPQSALNPLWLRFHGLQRPSRPNVSDLAAALEELGLHPTVERFTRRLFADQLPRSELVAMTRRRLCLTPDRDGEVDAALGARPALFSAEAACVWWPAAAPA